jgi:hypothetical protein
VTRDRHQRIPARPCRHLWAEAQHADLDRLQRARCSGSAQRCGEGLIGRPVAAFDIPSETNGTARYGIDATVEGMVYARPKRSALAFHQGYSKLVFDPPDLPAQGRLCDTQRLSRAGEFRSRVTCR